MLRFSKSTVALIATAITFAVFVLGVWRRDLGTHSCAEERGGKWPKSVVGWVSKALA